MNLSKQHILMFSFQHVLFQMQSLESVFNGEYTADCQQIYSQSGDRFYSISTCCNRTISSCFNEERVASALRPPVLARLGASSFPSSISISRISILAAAIAKLFSLLTAWHGSIFDGNHFHCCYLQYWSSHTTIAMF